MSKATGVKLALDGDLILYDTDKAGSTELAVRKLAGKLDMSESQIHRALKKGDSIDFEKTDLYQQVYAIAEKESWQEIATRNLAGNYAGKPENYP